MTLVRTSAILAVLALTLAACSSGDGGAEDTFETAVFGDGKLDPTLVLAEVDGYAITRRMVDLRLEELPKEEKLRYSTDEGQRLLLREMVDQYLRVREAQNRQLADDPLVSRSLIAHRRQTLDAVLLADLVSGKEPTQEEIREFFEASRDKYQRLGTVHASHIETESRERADAAYEEALNGGRPFPYVVAEFSINKETKKNQGELGYFNKSGFLPHVLGGKELTEKVWDLEKGLNPPIQVGDRWHVIYIHGREYGRPQTLDEAYNRVLNDMRFDFEGQIVAAWEGEARDRAAIEYFGDFRPGKGKTPKQLMERAQMVKDELNKLDLYRLVVEDYPESEYADDALFLAANVFLDRWGDRPAASRQLHQLLQDYPESSLAEDAQYILENMSRADFTSPKSIEDLKR